MDRPTMQAIQVHQYGGPEVLQLERIPRPEAQEKEVLVRVYAAAVLPADCATREGSFVQKTLPYIPGTAFAGVIEEVGPGVTNFQKGQAVCGRTSNGTSAEYVTVIADPPTFNPDIPVYLQPNAITPLALKPETLSFDEASTLSGGATTAWTSLLVDGGLQAGQRVLITAAAGGVGLFAVQFARWKGAHVIATCGPDNVDYVRSLGAETVIDYTTTRFEDIVQDVDVVLASVVGETERAMRVVERGGTLVSIVDIPPQDLAEELGIRAMKNATVPVSKHLREIVQLIDEGYARPEIQRSFPLHEASQAHALCETGHGRGRIVLHIAD